MDLESRIKIGIIGITGRMGKIVESVFSASSRYQVIGGYSRRGPLSLESLFACSDVVIDFSSPEIMLNVLKTTLQSKKPTPLILCTTGWEKSVVVGNLFAEVARKTTVVECSNTSIGANLQMFVVQKLAEILPADFDIDILEKHHRHKLDVPSGTAKSLANSVLRGKVSETTKLKAQDFDWCVSTSPLLSGPRKTGQIEINSQRSGQLPGDHEVSFTSSLEQLSVRHVAYDRRLFAQGAMVICDWIVNQVGKDPSFVGQYNMFDVLGLKNLGSFYAAK